MSTSWDCLGTRLALSFIEVVPLFAFNAAWFKTLIALAILDETTLLTLAITHKIFSSTYTAATCCTGLALLSETRFAADALTIKTKIAFFALLALEAIVALFAVDVNLLRAQPAESVFNERTFNAALVGEDEKTEQNTCSSDDGRHYEYSQ
jgi:anaerobic C4-dicarboxylate transporter